MIELGLTDRRWWPDGDLQLASISVARRDNVVRKQWDTDTGHQNRIVFQKILRKEWNIYPFIRLLEVQGFLFAICLCIWRNNFLNPWKPWNISWRSNWTIYLLFCWHVETLGWEMRGNSWWQWMSVFVFRANLGLGIDQMDDNPAPECEHRHGQKKTYSSLQSCPVMLSASLKMIS